ncbi:MAG: TlpA family protein disulfide reductase [Flavobacteriales bacterium]|nr:TlpA family protein disulfide reductase [Flavobacteriales bacterium]
MDNRRLIKNFLILFIGVNLISCQEEKPASTAIIQGKIPVETTELFIDYDGEWEELLLSEDGQFLDTLSINAPQYVQLAFDNNRLRFYVTPGDKVVVSGDSSISFSGSNARINDYLYQVSEIEEALAEYEYNSHNWIFNLNETDYIHFRDSIKEARLNELAQLPAGTEDFQDFHQKDILYDYQYDIARYPNYYSFFHRDYKPTELITTFYKGVSLDNEEYAKNYSSYCALVDLILYQQIDEIEDSTLSTLEAHLSVIEEIESPTILHRRLVASLPHFNSSEENIEAMLDRMLGMAKLDRTKEEIQDHYNIVSQLKPGSPSPDFDFENYAGGNTKLSDLRGKLVYIDVWATWCGPCILEIPHLKELEKELQDKNIEFVSISLDEPRFKNMWKNMVENKELGGIQLISDNGWDNEFVRGYGIQAIPQFILLDEEGNIISAHAERPSDETLKECLIALL